MKLSNKNIRHIKELVPEIHDIGKLINKESTEIEHNFENYPGKFEGLPEIKENPTWKGIREHHCQLPKERKEKILEEYPKSKETIILAIADNLASTVSRHIELGGASFYNVYKLWNPSTNITRLSDAIGAHSIGKEWIEKIVNFVNRNPTKEEYLREFGKYLERRCEDAHPGCNVTSLLTHSILTGKFYRILKKINIPLQIETEPKKEKICELVNKKLPKEIRLTIIKCKVKIPKYIYRTRDLNIFKIREELLKIFQEKYPEVFFRTSDELILFSKDENILKEIENKIKQYVLVMEIVKTTSTLEKNDFKNNFIKILCNKGEKEIVYSGFLEEAIPSHIGICEICQLNPAKPYNALSDKEKQLLTNEKGQVDNLCEKCIKVREYGEPLAFLAKWEEGEVVWIKITLDFKKLEEILTKFYREYLLNLLKDLDEDREVEIRPSLIAEFHNDYNRFLEEFNKKIHETFDNEEKRVQDVLEDLICIKINKLSEIIKILEIYNGLIKKFFPKFEETCGSPIMLVISCSNVKFPFFEHWRYLENPKHDIEIVLVGRGEIELELNKLEKLLELELKNKTALEKLAKISEISEQLAWMQIFSEEGIKNYPELQKALREGFKLSDLLTYVKITSD
jgi:hypothetical protein